ncbi:hypothetical protein [Halobacterium sp. CBA1126]|nr:hypothetical protein [Halobacterium sp. CBA1126]
MVTHYVVAAAMCHHWEAVPIRDLEPAAEDAEEEPDDVTKEVAPA